MPDQPERSQTADRAAQVLLAISQQPQSLSQLGRTLDVERRALGRIVSSLERYRLLSRAKSTGIIDLGPAAVNLARAASRRRGLVELGRAPVTSLMQSVKCTTIIHERVGDYLVPQLILAPNDVLAVSYPAVRTVPLWQGIGRAVLATLSQVELEPYLQRSELPDAADRIEQTRQSGIAISYGEVLEGLTAVGSAVRDEDGQAIGVVAIVALASTHPEAHSRAVRDTARRLTTLLTTGDVPTADPPADRGAPRPTAHG